MKGDEDVLTPVGPGGWRAGAQEAGEGGVGRTRGWTATPGSALKRAVPRLEHRVKHLVQMLRVWSAQDAGSRQSVHCGLTSPQVLALPGSSSSTEHRPVASPGSLRVWPFCPLRRRRDTTFSRQLTVTLHFSDIPEILRRMSLGRWHQDRRQGDRTSPSACPGN